MILGSWGSTRGPIGLDVGRALIKAVQLSGVGRRARVAASAVYPRADRDGALTGGEVEELSVNLRRDGFVGRNVVLAAPAKALFSGVLELPPRTAETPLDDIARLEVARLSRREPDAFEMAYWGVPSPARSGQATHVMAVAGGHREIEGCLDLFEARRFDVEAVDVLPWALARVLTGGAGGQSPDGNAFVLDLGWSAARFCVVLDRLVVYERQMPDAGLVALAQALMERIDIDRDAAEALVRRAQPAAGQHPQGAANPDGHHVITDHFDALAEELRNAFSFVVHRYPSAKADRLHLVGGGALVPGLASWLSDILGMGVEPLSEGRIPEGGGPAHGELAPIFAAAIGLAQYGSGGGS